MQSRYRSRREAAAYLTDKGLRTSFGTLQKLATIGGGPKYQIFGNRAVYLDANLDEWAASKLSPILASTAEHAPAAKAPRLFGRGAPPGISWPANLLRQESRPLIWGNPALDRAPLSYAALDASFSQGAGPQSGMTAMPNGTYKTQAAKDADRDRQRELLTALSGPRSALRLDECGAWCVTGRHGSYLHLERPRRLAATRLGCSA